MREKSEQLILKGNITAGHIQINPIRVVRRLLSLNRIPLTLRKKPKPTPQPESAPPQSVPMGLPSNFMEEMVKRITSLVRSGHRGGYVDKSTKRCYRCQVLGHYAAECTAEKPVPSSKPTETKQEN